MNGFDTLLYKRYALKKYFYGIPIWNICNYFLSLQPIMIDKYRKHYYHFGDLIRNTRTQIAFLNQTQLAQMLGVKQSYISKIESGKVRIGIIEVWEMCMKMNISFAEFAKMLESRLSSDPTIKRNR